VQNNNSGVLISP